MSDVNLGEKLEKELVEAFVLANLAQSHAKDGVPTPGDIALISIAHSLYVLAEAIKWKVE